MKRFFLLTLLAATLVGCIRDEVGEISTIKPSDKIHNYSGEVAPGRLMVRLASVDDTLSVEGVELTIEPLVPRTSGESKLERWVIANFDPSLDSRVVAEAIAREECVEIVEFDIKMERIESRSLGVADVCPEPTRSVEVPFNDPELPYQWHYYNDGSFAEYVDEPSMCLEGADINLFNAWKYTAGDSRVIVAVMDGGIRADHPDLAANMWVNEREKNGLTGIDDDGNGYVDDVYGYNFVNDTGDIAVDAHGTHVAGTISAVNNNGINVCGIAGGTGNGDGVKLMSIQIFNGDDSCFAHQIAKGYKYAADNGAVLINNSWGYNADAYISDKQFEQYDSVLKDAVLYFEQNARLEGVMEGGLAIFAAGNETYANSAYPGAYHKWICVSAMSSNFTATCYTNYGPGVNITAPGGESCYGKIVCIASTSAFESWGYEYMQGTSMATPHVTGCAALAVSYALKRGYTLTTEQLRTYILTSVHDINPYQTGVKNVFDHKQGIWKDMELAPYAGKMGNGYIDAHLLLMQMDSTPCLYFKAGEEHALSLDAFFGTGSEDITYTNVSMSDADKAALGISSSPSIDSNGKLRIKCTKAGTGRITVRAIAGGNHTGGGDMIGGMEIEREFEIVVRGSVAANGGWL